MIAAWILAVWAPSTSSAAAQSAPPGLPALALAVTVVIGLITLRRTSCLSNRRARRLHLAPLSLQAPPELHQSRKRFCPQCGAPLQSRDDGGRD